MKTVRWLVRVFAEEEHQTLLTCLWFSSVRAMASVFDVTTATVSNTYHGQILPRGAMRFCEIHRCDWDP